MNEFDDYQIEAMRTAGEKLNADPLIYSMGGIGGEAGEYVDVVKKYLFHDTPYEAAREKAKKELGDVLWGVAQAAKAWGFKLSDVAAGNVEKLRARYPNGFSAEASRARVDTKETTFSNPTVTECYEFWKAWFNQPLEVKQRWLREPGKGGYYPPGSESPGYTGRPDPKEYFHVRMTQFGTRIDNATERVFWACHDSAIEWIKTVGLEKKLTFAPVDCVLRVIHYLPTDTGHVGEEHSDFNLLTVNVPATVPGLEIKRTDGVWFPTEQGIQVGDMLEIFTHGQYTATRHRVNAPANVHRYKAVFFYLPPLDFELRPGYTAKDYLYGPDGAMVKAGTAKIGVNGNG